LIFLIYIWQSCTIAVQFFTCGCLPQLC
jgi:hypothetical protein